jgi:RND family efflux transporter MFP subunit
VYAYFNVSEYDVLRLRAARRSAGQETTDKISPTPVYIGLANEVGYPHEAVLDYIAPEVDRTTGTIEARARFDNSKRELIAGLFVRVRVPVSEPKPALAVTERAIGMNQGQRYLLIVDGENKVVYRAIRAGLLEGGLRVIENGIGENDWVIVLGVQRVRPGVTVESQRVSMESVTGPASQPAAGSRPSSQTAH